jgi:hypothetical protein
MAAILVVDVTVAVMAVMIVAADVTAAEDATSAGMAVMAVMTIAADAIVARRRISCMGPHSCRERWVCDAWVC